MPTNNENQINKTRQDLLSLERMRVLKGELSKKQNNQSFELAKRLIDLKKGANLS